MNKKVFVVPKTQDLKKIEAFGTNEGCRLVRLPHPRTGQLVKFLLSDGELFELRQVTGENPHLKKSQQTLTDSGKTLNSMLIEINGSEGIISGNAAIYVATKFNLTYMLLMYFNKSRTGQRVDSIDGLEDSLNDFFGQYGDSVTPCEFSELPIGLIKESLESVCEVIEENDEHFYKFSMPKCCAFIMNKVEQLSENFPASIYTKLLKPMIVPAELDAETPKDVEKAAKVQMSFYLIGSYMSKDLMDKVADQTETLKSSLLQDYVDEQAQIRHKKQVAEQSLLQMNEQLASSNDNAKRAKPKKKVVKKETKKVTRGALDNFFKRN